MLADDRGRFPDQRHFSLRNPVRAIKDISRDLTCREAVPLNNGKKYSALELQKEYLDLAQRYYSTRTMSPDGR